MAPLAAPTSSAAGCTQYQTAWPQRYVDPNAMIDTAMNHPQFAFSPGGPATPYQIDVESQLRRRCTSDAAMAVAGIHDQATAEATA